MSGGAAVAMAAIGLAVALSAAYTPVSNPQRQPDNAIHAETLINVRGPALEVDGYAPASLAIGPSIAPGANRSTPGYVPIGQPFPQPY